MMAMHMITRQPAGNLSMCCLAERLAPKYSGMRSLDRLRPCLPETTHLPMTVIVVLRSMNPPCFAPSRSPSVFPGGHSRRRVGGWLVLFLSISLGWQLSIYLSAGIPYPPPQKALRSKTTDLQAWLFSLLSYSAQDLLGCPRVISAVAYSSLN